MNGCPARGEWWCSACAISSLPVPDSPRMQHRRAGADDLGHLLEHPPHRAAVADDVAEFVALFELLLELGVFLHQLPALLVHQALDPECLGDHAGRDPERVHGALGHVAGRVALLDGERADRPAVQGDGDAEEGDLLLPLSPGRGSVEEVRLEAHLGHHGRRPGLGDHAGDALAHAVAHPSGGPGIAQRRLDHEHAALVLQQGDRTAERAAVALEHLEHAVETGLQVQGAGERLAHLHQHGELAGVRLALAAQVRRGIGGASGRPGVRGAHGRSRSIGEQRWDVEDDLPGDAHHDPSTRDMAKCNPISAEIAILKVRYLDSSASSS